LEGKPLHNGAAVGAIAGKILADRRFGFGCSVSLAAERPLTEAPGSEFYVSTIEEIPALVRSLYRIVRDLEGLFPGRKFTPDGHLVGSIGEVLAAHRYGLELLPPSAERHDARASDGRLVQIKATQVRSVGLRSEPEFLLVLQLLRDGSTEEVFNGPGSLAWSHAGKMQRNGQRSIGVAKLRGLMEDVPPGARLAVLNKTPHPH
jgi:hypothetical protein